MNIARAMMARTSTIVMSRLWEPWYLLASTSRLRHGAIARQPPSLPGGFGPGGLGSCPGRATPEGTSLLLQEATPHAEILTLVQRRLEAVPPDRADQADGHGHPCLPQRGTAGPDR